MSDWKLLFDEIWYRKTNFLLSLAGVTLATTLFVAGPTLIAGYSRETQDELARLEDDTRKLMLKMGFNLMIVHRDTDMSDFWSSDYSAVDMPQEYVDRLAAAPQLTLVTHLVATLQQRIDWTDRGVERKVLLVGYLPETPKVHEKKKKPMGYDIEPGTAYVGHIIGAGRQPGEEIDVLGKSFRIAQILPEKGSKEDITIAMSLADAQSILDKPGRVNQILAIGCRCMGTRLTQVRAQLEETLPETKITEFQSIAIARDEQRERVKQQRTDQQLRMENLAGVVTPAGVLVCGVWVGLLALANVRERRTEIGLLRALGKGSLRIAGLFLGKAILLGVVGGLLGFWMGTGSALVMLTRAMQITTVHFQPAYDLLPWALFGAPVLCAVATYLPTLSAVLQDPAVVLRDT